MKIIVTIIPIYEVTNSRLPLFVYPQKLKTRIKFKESWWSGNEKYFYYSDAEFN